MVENLLKKLFSKLKKKTIVDKKLFFKSLKENILNILYHLEKTEKNGKKMENPVSHPCMVE